jgi:hypothetical protein
MNWLGWLIIGALIVAVLFSLHPFGRRFYGHHYGRARRYAYNRYRRYRRY